MRRIEKHSTSTGRSIAHRERKRKKQHAYKEIAHTPHTDNIHIHSIHIYTTYQQYTRIDSIHNTPTVHTYIYIDSIHNIPIAHTHCTNTIPIE